MTRRSFLFLQGPCTPFFARLARRLKSEGHAVHRVNFCGGDAAYWGAAPATRFAARPADLPSHLDQIYARHGITDQVLFGDRRPVHQPAVGRAERHGLRNHVFEEGYFRPWWITLEREGVNGHSLLPRDPDWFREAGRRVVAAPVPQAFHSPFRVRAFHDVAYHVAGLLNPLLYRGYRTHAPVTAPLEYAGYARRLARLRLIRAREHGRVRALVASGHPYFLLPLQLNGDAQIRDHSRFEHMGEVIDYVLESFARHAPAGSRLVIKNHPLDMGLVDYDRVVRAAERRLGLDGRTVYLEDGDLLALARHARGMVTVNSTAGLVALEQGCAVLCLSDPIYNLRGLTSQARLDDFWREPEPPEAAFFDCFRRVVLHTTQVNGGFYCERGIALAVDNASRVLTAERSPLEGLLPVGQAG